MVGAHVSGQGISLYVRNVKLSQRSNGKKNAKPASHPQPNAVRGGEVTAT